MGRWGDGLRVTEYVRSFGLTIIREKLKVRILKRDFPFRQGIAEVDLKEYFCLKSQVRINKTPGKEECGESSRKHCRKTRRGASH